MVILCKYSNWGSSRADKRFLQGKQDNTIWAMRNGIAECNQFADTEG